VPFAVPVVAVRLYDAAYSWRVIVATGGTAYGFAAEYGFGAA
jgi:hypothetical protein